MPNTSFAGWEGLIQVAGATVAVVEHIEGTLVQELERVMAVGDFKPQDLKEVSQHTTWRARRAYFVDASAADFFTKAIRDANGYLTSFSMTFRLRDNSTGVPADKTFTFASCKVSQYGVTIPAGRGVVMESLEGEATNLTRA